MLRKILAVLGIFFLIYGQVTLFAYSGEFGRAFRKCLSTFRSEATRTDLFNHGGQNVSTSSFS